MTATSPLIRARNFLDDAFEVDLDGSDSPLTPSTPSHKSYTPSVPESPDFLTLYEDGSQSPTLFTKRGYAAWIRNRDVARETSVSRRRHTLHSGPSAACLWDSEKTKFTIKRKKLSLSPNRKPRPSLMHAFRQYSPLVTSEDPFDLAIFTSDDRKTVDSQAVNGFVIRSSPVFMQECSEALGDESVDDENSEASVLALLTPVSECEGLSPLAMRRSVKKSG